METRLKQEEILDRQDAKRDMINQRGRGRGRKRCGSWWVRCTSSSIQEEARHSVTRTTQSSGYEPYPQP